MPYEPPKEYIINEMNKSEGFSNGVWNPIICYYLSQETHIVSPESRVDDGRPDLLICTNADPPFSILVFEGNRGATIGGRNLALVALGGKCRFIGNYNGDDRQLRPSEIDPGKWRKIGQGIVTNLDIVKNATEIDQSFVLTLKNAPIPP